MMSEGSCSGPADDDGDKEKEIVEEEEEAAKGQTSTSKQKQKTHLELAAQNLRQESVDLADHAVLDRARVALQDHLQQKHVPINQSINQSTERERERERERGREKGERERERGEKGRVGVGGGGRNSMRTSTVEPHASSLSSL